MHESEKWKKSLSRVRLFATPMDCSLPGSSVHGILQARVLEWVATAFSKLLPVAKSLQSCPTLCDPIDGSPPGSPISGILQARTLEWLAISFSNAWNEKWKGSCSVVSDSSQPHGLQPTRLLRPWDFPGKSTGVGCHRLLQNYFLVPLNLKKKKMARRTCCKDEMLKKKKSNFLPQNLYYHVLFNFKGILCPTKFCVFTQESLIKLDQSYYSANSKITWRALQTTDYVDQYEKLREGIFLLLWKNELFFFFFLIWLCGIWDLSSLTRDQSHTLALEAWSLNHWTTRGRPKTSSC